MRLYSPDILAQQFEQSIRQTIHGLSVVPTLHVVQIGDDFASTKYITLKQKKCDELGIPFELHRFALTANVAEVIELIQSIPTKNHGVILQLPVPERFESVLKVVPASMDIDFLGVGSDILWDKNMLPPTIQAIYMVLCDILKTTNLSGKTVAIVGQGKLVGKPLLRFLANQNASIISINIDTKNPQELTKHADIVISAAGQANLINREWVQPDTIIIDAATFESNGKIRGDVDHNNLYDSNILCPSPGGIGKLTILSLIDNLLKIQNITVS